MKNSGLESRKCHQASERFLLPPLIFPQIQTSSRGRYTQSFEIFLAGNVCSIWNCKRIFRLNGLFSNSVFLATLFPGSPSVGTGRRKPWERGCVFGRGGEGGWGGISLLKWSAFIRHFKNEREIGSSWLSQRLLELLLWTGGKIDK